MNIGRIIACFWGVKGGGNRFFICCKNVNDKNSFRQLTRWFVYQFFVSFSNFYNFKLIDCQHSINCHKFHKLTSQTKCQQNWPAFVCFVFPLLCPNSEVRNAFGRPRLISFESFLINKYLKFVLSRKRKLSYFFFLNYNFI